MEALLKNTKKKNPNEQKEIVKILINDKKEKEKTNNIYEEEIYGRFKYLVSDLESSKRNPKNKQNQHDFKVPKGDSDTFKFLPIERQREIKDSIKNNDLTFSDLSNIEKQIFFDFVKRQKAVARWVPFWEITEGVPDLDIEGKFVFWRF